MLLFSYQSPTFESSAEDMSVAGDLPTNEFDNAHPVAQIKKTAHTLNTK